MAHDFVKMQAAGNDFIVFAREHFIWPILPVEMPRLAHRHFGIGCDQLLLIAPSSDPHCDWHYGVYNADGSPAGHCVNGARCVAYWAFRFSHKKHLRFVIDGHYFSAHLGELGQVSVSMPMPCYDQQLGGHDDSMFDGPIRPYETAYGTLAIAFASVGNHHCLVFLTDEMRDVEAYLSCLLEKWPNLHQKYNVSFIHLLSSHHLSVDTYERGVGWTLSCGSAAVCAASTAAYYTQVSYPMTITMPGGDLSVVLDSGRSEVQISGLVKVVYTGQWLCEGDEHDYDKGIF